MHDQLSLRVFRILWRVYTCVHPFKNWTGLAAYLVSWRIDDSWRTSYEWLQSFLANHVAKIGQTRCCQHFTVFFLIASTSKFAIRLVGSWTTKVQAYFLTPNTSESYPILPQVDRSHPVVKAKIPVIAATIYRRPGPAWRSFGHALETGWKWTCWPSRVTKRGTDLHPKMKGCETFSSHFKMVERCDSQI